MEDALKKYPKTRNIYIYCSCYSIVCFIATSISGDYSADCRTDNNNLLSVVLSLGSSFWRYGDICIAL